ncbi:citrate synthase [Brevibacillus laterosporus]|uniref:citrate synthase n=1 Tax=Brevibacillus laterosporus TaxID=1465 RepID=UPI0024052059|nr:citrate synthase [Brevibacillus laterosporus]MDF9412017.1 citrate synthase [Brevibacillus laterosporus]
MTATKGLEGVVAAQSAVCSIIDGVLCYRGINVDELAENATFEEVVYLLWHGALPKRDQLEVFQKELGANAQIPQELIESIRNFPEGVHSMAALRTAVSSLALYDKEAQEMSKEANYRKSIRLTAQTPTIVAAYDRLRKGLEPIAPREEYSIAKNFLYMLSGEEPSDTAVKAFDTALILHADHEFNASTFSARVTVATLTDIYSGVVSAIGTLKGPLHGGANEAVATMLEKIGSVDRVVPYIRQALDNKEKIMGFGHRVYKDGDPRAKWLRHMSKELTEQQGKTELYEMSVKIEEMVTGEKGLKPNVDFYSASVYVSLGLAIDLFTPIFAISRMSGWTAHIMEQYENNRLIRPRADYIGPVNQHFKPIDQR